MKKRIAFILVAVFLLSALTGCIGSEEKVFISGASDLAGKIIGVQQGTTGQDYCDEEIENADVRPYKTPADAVLDLNNKKIDAIVIDEMPAQRLITQYDDLMILEEPLTEEEYAIAVRKGDTTLLDSINQTLARIKSDDTYDSFVNYYITKESTDALPAYEPQGTDKLMVGTSPDFEPFEYLGSGNDIIGFDVEVCQEIADDMGKSLEMVGYDFDALIAALTSEKVDMVMSGMTVNEERLMMVDFSDPYYNASQVIIVRKSSFEGAK